MSRSSSPYKSQLFERDELPQPSPQKVEIPPVDNKIIFSKNIQLKKSPAKNKLLDQSVEDDDEKFRLIKKAFKRVNGTIDKGDHARKFRAFIMMRERIEMVKALFNEKKPVIR